jgi:hypothetical protein
MKKKFKEYNLLVYVDDSELKMKKFDSFEEMGKFVEKFQKKYPDHLASDSGYWIDYCITKIHGDVHFFTDGISLK